MVEGHDMHALHAKMQTTNPAHTTFAEHGVKASEGIRTTFQALQGALDVGTRSEDKRMLIPRGVEQRGMIRTPQETQTDNAE